MRVKITKSKNSESLYIIKSLRVDGKSTSKIIEKLGTIDEVRAKADGQDPYLWAKVRAKELTEKEKNNNARISISIKPNERITENQQRSFNGGYLFLQQIYHSLGLHKVCDTISEKYPFKYDLDSILSRLVYSRILYPTSNKATFNRSKSYLEQPNFELHQIYRALEVIYKENDLIQSELYKNSKSICERNSKVLYYDCTNFFFEIEQEDGIRQYGHSKENRPNPIVQMGLFMDGNGIPLAFDITPGNTNEQTTLQPLEKKVIKDFEMSKFVVCTDAGLSSNANRKFNDKLGRAFITTQSVKKLKKHLKDWALNETGWSLPTQPKRTYTLTEIIEEDNDKNIYYKERWINENDLEQRIIVSFSVKYKKYLEKIRNRQIERAEKTIKSGKKIPKKVNSQDYKRFIEQKNITEDGEIAENEIYSINNDQITKESQYDGFYAVCTNLDDDISSIININRGRWEIEESFRIMKSEFKARPVNLSVDERIKAHFLICFIALTIYRLVERKLELSFTHCEILDTLKSMNFLEIKGEGYIPSYTRTKLTDSLHEHFGFYTDYEIITQKNIKKIFKQTKS